MPPPFPAIAPLVVALRALPPRALAFLTRRHLEQRGLSATALHYGIPEDAAATHLFRATWSLGRELGWIPAGLAAPEGAAELKAARWLESGLRAGPAAAPGPAREPPLAAGLPPELSRRLLALGLQLTADGEALLHALEVAERAEFESPAGRRRERLRLLAIAVLVLLTVWLSLS